MNSCDFLEIVYYLLQALNVVGNKYSQQILVDKKKKFEVMLMEEWANFLSS